MKKMSLFVAGLSVLAGLAVQAASTNVTSVNVVGYVKTDVPSAGKLVLVGVPFTDVGDTNSTTLESILGTNQLRSGTFYTSADRVLLWDKNAATYRYFAIRSSDGRFHSAQNSTTWGQAATNPVVRPGDGLWIWAPASSSNSVTVSLLGQVVGSQNSTVTINPGLNLLSHQFTTSLDVNNSNLTNANALGATFYASADQIYVWDSVAQTYHKWALKLSDRKWHYADNTTQWGQGPVTNVINVAEGFWYRRMTNSVMTWTEDSLYYNNLKN